MRTAEEFKKRLYSYKRNLFMKGERIGRDHPALEPAVNLIAESYRLPTYPEFADLFTATSHISGNKINRFTHTPRSVDDLLAKQEATRVLCTRVGGCSLRCGGCDTLSGLSVMTKEADDAEGTEYHKRFMKFVQHMQDNDMHTNILLTDPKGDRSMRPHQQIDPDMYLRIVERKSDGIVVNGAKLFGVSGQVDEITAAPTRAMTEKDRDYALSFSVPADHEGVTIFVKQFSAPTREQIKAPFADYGICAEYVTVFDHVFVPWERVWLCGEWKFAGRAAQLISLFHRSSYTGCKPAVADLIVGAVALLAEYNNLEKTPHIKEKLAHLIATGTLIHGTGIAGAVNAKASSSGTYIPDPVYINAARYHAGVSLFHEIETLADVAGGQGFNIPSEEDFLNPEVGHYLQKYVKRKADVSAEDIWRLFHLVYDMIYSAQGGWVKAAGLHGGGSPAMEQLGILANVNLEEKKKLIKYLAGIRDSKK
jgi:aromatic ring hydroxylase